MPISSPRMAMTTRISSSVNPASRDTACRRRALFRTLLIARAIHPRAHSRGDRLHPLLQRRRADRVAVTRKQEVRVFVVLAMAGAALEFRNARDQLFHMARQLAPVGQCRIAFRMPGQQWRGYGFTEHER